MSLLKTHSTGDARLEIHVARPEIRDSARDGRDSRLSTYKRLTKLILKLKSVEEFSLRKKRTLKILYFSNTLTTSFG